MVHFAWAECPLPTSPLVQAIGCRPPVQFAWAVSDALYHFRQFVEADEWVGRSFLGLVKLPTEHVQLHEELEMVWVRLVFLILNSSFSAKTVLPFQSTRLLLLPTLSTSELGDNSFLFDGFTSTGPEHYCKSGMYSFLKDN